MTRKRQETDIGEKNILAPQQARRDYAQQRSRAGLRSLISRAGKRGRWRGICHGRGDCLIPQCGLGRQRRHRSRMSSCELLEGLVGGGLAARRVRWGESRCFGGCRLDHGQILYYWGEFLVSGTYGLLTPQMHFPVLQVSGFRKGLWLRTGGADCSASSGAFPGDSLSLALLRCLLQSENDFMAVVR